VRFELLMAGKLKAAALPEPFLTLAKQSGATIVADDTTAKSNLSQTVLVMSDDFLGKPGGQATKTALLKAWTSQSTISTEPGDVSLAARREGRGSQAARHELPDSDVSSAALPKQADVDAVLAWMTRRATSG